MVEINNLCLRKENFELKNISLKVEEGEYCAILGPTGSGKTLLLESIAGLIQPNRGSIYLNGKDVTHLPPERRDIGYLPQDYALFPFMNVRNNIAIGMKLRKIKSEVIEKKIKDISSEMNIEHLLDRNPATLSGGEKQRVALARALVVDPKIILLDEPYSSIDTNLKRSLYWFTKRLHKKTGKTIIHITHDLEEAYTLSDKIGIIVKGDLIQFGRKEKIVRYPRTTEAARVIGIDNIFRGEIIESNGKELLVRHRNSLINIMCSKEEAVQKSELKKGSTINFCILSDEIEIMKGDTTKFKNNNNGYNMFHGKIIAITTFGSINTLYCKVTNTSSLHRQFLTEKSKEYDFVIKVTRDRFEQLQLSLAHEITFHLSPDRIHILKNS